jgi:hypothetical protein
MSATLNQTKSGLPRLKKTQKCSTMLENDMRVIGLDRSRIMAWHGCCKWWLTMCMHSAWLGVLTHTLIVVLKVATSTKCIQCSYEILCWPHGTVCEKQGKRNQRKDLHCNVICMLTEMTHPIAYRAKQKVPRGKFAICLSLSWIASCQHHD